LVSLQRRYGAHDVQVISVSVDDESTQGQISPFIERVKINFPIWMGATIWHMQSVELGSALPATAILDRDGQFVFRIIGTITKRSGTWFQSSHVFASHDAFSISPLVIFKRAEALMLLC
jgi:hypothetical protein